MKYTQEQLNNMEDYEVGAEAIVKYFSDVYRGSQFEASWISCFSGNILPDENYFIYKDSEFFGNAYYPHIDWLYAIKIAETYDIVPMFGYGVACTDPMDFSDEYSLSRKRGLYYESRHKNIKRAICEVFLMMDI